MHSEMQLVVTGPKQVCLLTLFTTVFGVFVGPVKVTKVPLDGQSELGAPNSQFSTCQYGKNRKLEAHLRFVTDPTLRLRRNGSVVWASGALFNFYEQKWC